MNFARFLPLFLQPLRRRVRRRVERLNRADEAQRCGEWNHVVQHGAIECLCGLVLVDADWGAIFAAGGNQARRAAFLAAVDEAREVPRRRYVSLDTWARERAKGGEG